MPPSLFLMQLGSRGKVSQFQRRSVSHNVLDFHEAFSEPQDNE